MRFGPRFGSALKWLIPGMGVKRWLLLLFGGITIVSLGVGYLLADVYRTWTFPSVFYYLTLQIIPRAWRGLLFGVAGVAAITIAVLQLNRSLLSAFRAPGQSRLADIIYDHRQRGRGPKVVAIGGGTGLSALLRGLKEHTDNITAIPLLLAGLSLQAARHQADQALAMQPGYGLHLIQQEPALQLARFDIPLLDQPQILPKFVYGHLLFFRHSPLGNFII